MRYGHALGIDPGLVNDPTGLVLIKIMQPSVVISDGKVLDAHTGEPVPLPEGVTVSEFCLPRYEVIDARRRKGLSFNRIAKEAKATSKDLAGDMLCVVDNTGLGRGATEAIRQAGVPTMAVNLTSGSRVTGGRWDANLPVSIMWSSLFAVMAQGRLRIADKVGADLADELRSIDTKTTDAGNVTFEAGGADHHADTAYALAMAVAILEDAGQRLARAAAAAEGGPRPKRRRTRRRAHGNTAKRVLRQRLQESKDESLRHAQAERERFAAVGWGTKVD